jgi:FkbM family methyltransferase
MRLKDKLRVLLFNILGERNVDKFRYLKFSYKFNKFLKYKNKDVFAEKFSEFYEPEMALIPKILSSPKVIIDVGSNYGPYSFFLSKLYPGSKIFAFEPATRSMDIFRKIIKKFGLNNVIPIKKGLGSKEEIKEIIMPLQYTILAYVSDKKTIKNKEDQAEAIEITTLDNFIKRNKIKNLDFIKCDVEGFELEVFKGAGNSIKKFKPIILVEVEERHTKKYGLNPQKVLEFFKKLGYSCSAVKGRSLIKTDLIKKENPLYLFFPKKHR